MIRTPGGLVPAARMAVSVLGVAAVCSDVGGGSRTVRDSPGQKPASSVPRKTTLRSADEAEEQIKQLVVMIRGELADGEAAGAGIILGSSPSRVYIATANHVVRRGAEEARNLRVEFRWLPGEPVEAVLLSHADATLDLAVLSVANPRNLGMPKLPFDRLGTPSELRRRDPVYFVGFPNGKPWHSRVTPDPISQTSADTLRFESTFLAQGHSGGALVDRNWQLVGMIRSDQPPEGEAVSIDRVLEKLREWNYPVRLSKPTRSTDASRTPPSEPPKTPTGSSGSASGASAEIRYFGRGAAGRTPALCYSIENAVSARIDPGIGDLDPKSLGRGCVPLKSKTGTKYTLVAIGRDGQERAQGVDFASRPPASERFQVTAVWADVRIPSSTGAEASASFVGPCPKEFLFIGTITANGPGTVVYRWERSDGVTGSPMTLEFTTAGTLKPEYYRWSLGRADPDYSRSIRTSVTLVAVRPNRLASKPVWFTLECRNGD